MILGETLLDRATCGYRITPEEFAMARAMFGGSETESAGDRPGRLARSGKAEPPRPVARSSRYVRTPAGACR